MTSHTLAKRTFSQSLSFIHFYFWLINPKTHRCTCAYTNQFISISITPSRVPPPTSPFPKPTTPNPTSNPFPRYKSKSQKQNKPSPPKPIKKFTLTGAPELYRPLLWIWRELFVSLLSTCDPTTPTPTPIFTPGEREGKGRLRELGAVECGKEDGDGKRKKEEVDEMIGRMLADIERVKGWRGVQRVLSGGRVCEFFFFLPCFIVFLFSGGFLSSSLSWH
jgi:hypothetical protein